MKARFWLILAFMLFSNSVTHSQSITWPLSPADVFAPDIEIREVEIEPSLDQSAKTWDDELRLIVIDGKVIPYPQVIASIGQLYDWNEPLVLFTASMAADRNDYNFWAYRRDTGQLSLFEDPCGVVTNPYADLETFWVIYRTNIEGETHLCNIITGELRGNLPVGRNWDLSSGGGYSQKITISPDGRWLVLIGERGPNEEDLNSAAEVYSYDLMNDQIVLMGSDTFTDSTTSYYFDRWIDQWIFISTGNIVISYQAILVATVGQQDSLHHTISDRIGATFLDNPPRYVIGVGSQYEDGACGRTTYDVETDTLTTLDLDGLCRPEYGSIAGVGYYRDVPYGGMSECCTPLTVDVAEVPLVRYDTRTRERQELYRGEIERIRWVSPDERYAILLIDNSGKIDLFPYLSSYDHNRMSMPSEILVDLETGKIIGYVVLCEYPAVSEWDAFNDDQAQNEGIELLPDGSFLVISNDGGATCGGREALFAYRLDPAKPDNIEPLPVDDPVILTPDRKGLLFWTPAYHFDGTPPAEQGISIYDLTTGEIYPFIKPLDTSRFAIELSTIEASPSTVDTPTITVKINAQTSDLNPQIYGQFQLEMETSETGAPEFTLFQYTKPETVVEQHGCVLTTLTGVNLRVGAGGNLDQFGTAEAGKRLVGIAQEVSPNDGLIWYELSTGGWVREDFVSKTSGCTTLTDSSLSEVDENITIEPTSEVAGLTCQITTLLDVNFRSEPSTEANKIGSALTDTTLEADGQIPGTDSFTWWRLVDAQGWVRQDLVAEAPECATLPVVTLEPIPTREPGLLTCDITTLQGINFRAQPSADSEKTGSAAIDTVLEADGQIPGGDGFIWWRLVDAQGWVRQDLVAKADGCATLPVIELP